ncbi:MAG: hypothetical protein M0Q91_17685 [Methanoregula sp.]|jgi:hypothetical protein|nr:hypothetical protein [Methanoregula sp.]
MSCHIEKDGKYLTGNIQKGWYEYTSSFELRYTFEDIKRAEFIAGMYAGTVIQE